MFTPIPPRFEIDEQREHPSERPRAITPRATTRAGFRLPLATCVGFGAVILSGLLRINARELSTTENGARLQPDVYAFYTEAGSWAIGFGVLVVALCLIEWVRRDPTAQRT